MSLPTLVFTVDTDESGRLLPEVEKGHHPPADDSDAHTPHSAHPTLGHGFSSGSILRSRSVRYVAARYQEGTDKARHFWGRLTGKGRRRIGWAESLQNIALSSCECSCSCNSVSFPLTSLGWRRAERPVHHDTRRLGLVLGRVGRDGDICP